jgi:hypothetical protein
MRLSPFISFYAGFLGVSVRSSRLIRRGKAAVALMLRGAAHEPGGYFGMEGSLASPVLRTAPAEVVK